jgi:2-polyprenyl-3-methyl-5-hydroxy-6-metoxy-1,4-benzoquinol methylase
MKGKSRIMARSAAKKSLRLLPDPIAYRLRAMVEKVIYNRTPVIHDLPEIFHYWSNRYLRPKFEALGFSSPEDFMVKELARLAGQKNEPLRCISLGAGRCELELSLVSQLLTLGHTLKFTCTDINKALLEVGKENALAAGVSEQMDFAVTDVNRLDELGTYDAIIAMQCLHHFVELERVLDAVYSALSDDGLFLTGDVIGRNGHQIWPEALEALQVFWRAMPERLRVDCKSGRVHEEYDNFNYADVGFEGIRAQDILPLLVERFEFEVFAPSACIIIPFVDRRFGPNFDTESESDRALIDAIALADEELINSGRIKPTQLVAAMCKGTPSRNLSTTSWSPAETIRPV